MKQLQITVTTEGLNTAVKLDEADLKRPVSAVVADVVAPAVATNQPLQASAFRALAQNPKTSYCVKQQDENGQVTEKFVSKGQSLSDVIEERTTRVALEVERPADGGSPERAVVARGNCSLEQIPVGERTLSSVQRR